MKSAHSTTNISAQLDKHESARSALNLLFGVHTALGLPTVVIGTAITWVSGLQQRHSIIFGPSNVDKILQSIRADARIELSPIVPLVGAQSLYPVPDHVPYDWMPEGDYRAIVFFGCVEFYDLTLDEQTQYAEMIVEFLQDRGLVAKRFKRDDEYVIYVAAIFKRPLSIQDYAQALAS
jgi:hypothetical protein